ncbi:MAG TPA: hypothetical protein VK447_02805 [Myxococcaceae bacterium]|nr:hypothetical protein [Myxococcaceae bacterium]
MKRIRWDWRLLKLIAESRGFLIKEIPGQLPEKKFKKRKGLAESTLHGKAKKGKPASRKVAEYLASEEGLPTRKGFEKTSKVVRLGLAAMNGLPSPTVAGKLDALSGKLDTTHAKIDINGAKLDSHTAKLGSHGEKLDAIRTELAAFRAEHKSGRHVTGTVLGILLLVGLFAGRQVLTNTSNAETPTSTAAALVRAALGGLLDLGKKTEEYWIPDAPASWQKLAQDCDRSLGEEPINGGCWVRISIVNPPCGKLFRHGDACYRPVAADPTKPVGLVRTLRGQP